MDTLFAAHSGLRYLVLLAGLVALAWFAWGKLSGRPFVRPAPALLAVFTGLVDLQMLLGIALLAGGLRPPIVWGHVALMLSAVVALHLVGGIHKRRPQPSGYGLPLIGVALALTLILVGILSLGRPIL
ncbi:MAG TPA: hypothetical protein VMR66_00835 [Gemmatimonadota bacterium]|nr:hypothetical protein [Gemmatimonadota bacterium]